jgi:hypothetical protein
VNRFTNTLIQGECVEVKKCWNKVKEDSEKKKNCPQLNFYFNFHVCWKERKKSVGFVSISNCFNFCKEQFLPFSQIKNVNTVACKGNLVEVLYLLQ